MKYSAINQFGYVRVPGSGGLTQNIRVENVRVYPEISLAYLFNPKNTMMIEVGYKGRESANQFTSSQTDWIFAALRMNLQNFYYDF